MSLVGEGSPLRQQYRVVRMHVYGVEVPASPYKELFHDLCHFMSFVSYVNVNYTGKRLTRWIRAGMSHCVPLEIVNVSTRPGPPDHFIKCVYSRSTLIVSVLSRTSLGRMRSKDSLACAAAIRQFVHFQFHPIISRAAAITLPSFCEHVSSIRDSKLIHFFYHEPSCKW